MKTKQKKHRTLIPGVTVEVNPSGSFTVTATAAAVKDWPWDGSTWPLSCLNRAHRFTFESNGDLCDMETTQKDGEDGENGRAASALANDCRDLACDLLDGLEDSKPPCVSCVIYLGNRGAFVDCLGFVNAPPVDSWSFIYRSRKGEHNPGNRLALHTCNTGKAFSQHGEVSCGWITENRRHRVKWEAIPRELRRHIKARLAEVEPKPRFKVWTKGNRGRYFDTLEAATAAAEEVRKQTGFILLITQEKGRP